MPSAMISRNKSKGVEVDTKDPKIQEYPKERSPFQARYVWVIYVLSGVSSAILITMTVPLIFGEEFSLVHQSDLTSQSYQMLCLKIVTGFLAMALPIVLRLGWITRSSTTHTIRGKGRTLEKILSETHDYGNKTLPDGVELLSEYMHARAHTSFIPQNGPVCAAASVAGALNVIFSYNADDEKAFRVHHGMRIYKTIFEDRRNEALEKLHKLIQVDAKPLLEQVLSQELCTSAKTSKEKFRSMLPAAVCAAIESPSSSTEETKSLAVLYDNISADRPSAALITERVRTVARAEWSVSKLYGKWPLPSGKILPSTAPVGNDRIFVCCKVLGMLREGKAVRCTSFMGLRSPCRHIVKKSMSKEDRDRLWEELKLSIQNEAAALIFHLHNHYALLFGWRELCVTEWQNDAERQEDHIRKQVLTARIGQNPAHWVDWEGDYTTISETKDKIVYRNSVLTSLTKWSGHKIMLIELPTFTSKRATVDPITTRLVDKLRAAYWNDEEREDERAKQDIETFGESDVFSENDADSGEEPES